MPGSDPRRPQGRLRKGLAAALAPLWFGWALAAAAGPATSAPPLRVVSINLCTDQLAMLLAAPGQLISVSALARDPVSSAMAEEAQAWPVNHAQAEEVFALHPDLVLAGTYSNPATVALLRRMGLRVETVAPVSSLDQLDATMADVGRALGREAEAQEMAERFDADLARLRRDPTDGPRAASYAANGYSLGNATLAGQVMAAAGLRNAAAEAGLSHGGTLPLERLLMLDPAVLITGTRYAAPSRAEAILDHPALRALVAQGTHRAEIADRDWICGTPHVLDALRALERASDAAKESGKAP